MKEKNYHVTCGTDDNYAQHCGVMLCSLLENNKNLTFIIHILIKELKEDNKQKLLELVSQYNSKVIFHKVDSSKLANVKYRINRPLSEAAYYRILLSSILDSSIDKVLYFDCDMVVLGSVENLFKIELDKYALAAVEDIGFPHSDLHRIQLSIPYGGKYFCSGMMLINLKYWREHDSEEKLIEYSERERFVFLHDQDSLNYVFKGQWYALPPKWNKFNMSLLTRKYFPLYNDYKEWRDSPSVIHYVNICKPWFKIRGVQNQNKYINYLSLTPWKNYILKKPSNIAECNKMVYFYYESLVLSYLPQLIQSIFIKIRSFFYK